MFLRDNLEGKGVWNGERRRINSEFCHGRYCKGAKMAIFVWNKEGPKQARLTPK